MADEISYDTLVDGTAEPAASPEPAAAEPAPASPEPAPSTEENDLDALLWSFDEQVGHQQQQPPQPDYQAAFESQWQQTQEAQQYAQQVAQQAQAEIDRKDALQLIDELRADLPVQPQMIGFWLDGQLQANPQLMEIWQNRTVDPQTYQRAPHYLARELQNMVSRLPDPELTETRKLVSAAVMRGASSERLPEPPPDFGNMSDAELHDYTRKNFGFV
jgi:hypothetical protein